MSKKSRQYTHANSMAQYGIKANVSSKNDQPKKAADTDRARLASIIAQGDYNRALQWLQANGHGSSDQNDRAVCLIRLGRFTEAVEILRSLVCNFGCIWMRKEAPVVYKTNFALSLLLGGHPAGCKSLLGEINDETNAAVIKMRSIISNWESTMTFWQRINWRWLGIEPENVTVHFDGVAGDFEQAVVALAPDRLPDSPSQSMQTAC